MLEMKNKFIIGDIVKEGVIEFINFSGNEYAISKEGEFTIVTTNPTPLPLTGDFLKENGFVDIGISMEDFNEMGIPIYGKQDINFCIVEARDNTFNIVFYGEKIKEDIKYVHELQHFLFGLGREL